MGQPFTDTLGSCRPRARATNKGTRLMSPWQLRSLRRTLSTPCLTELLAFDVGGLDHRPPLRNLGFLPGAERLRRQLILRRHLQSQVSSCLRTAGSFNASTAAALSFATIALWVPFGTHRPDHSVM